MNAVQRRRMLKTAKLLREYVKDDWFDLYSFYDYRGGVGDEPWDRYENKYKFDDTLAWKAKECGAVACAVGWLPAFFPSLVKLHKGEQWEFNGTRYTRGFRFAKDFFGISIDETRYLFAPRDNYETREHVADALERYVADRLP